MPTTGSRLGPGKLTIGTAPNDYSYQITNTRLEPTVEENEARGTLAEPTRAPTTKTTWALAGTVIQDWELESPQGFVEFCRVEDGNEHPFTFVPNTVVAKQYTGTCRVTAVIIGGEIVDDDSTSDFSFPVSTFTRGAVTP
jgi:hypothetical protein